MKAIQAVSKRSLKPNLTAKPFAEGVASLSRDYDRLVRQFDVLCEISHEMNFQSELKPLLAGIAENTARLLDADAVSVMLYDEHNRSFQTLAGWKNWDSPESAVVFSANEGVIGKVGATRRGMLVEDPGGHPDFKYFADSPHPSIKSLMCVPLVAKVGGEEKLIGVINTSRRDFSNRPVKDAFTEHDFRLFEKFSHQITAAIQRSKVYEDTREKNLQLQLLNDIGAILSSSLARTENFQKALDILVKGLDLSYGQALILQDERPLCNFNTLHRDGFLPSPVAELFKKGKPRKKPPFVAPASRCQFSTPLESNAKRIGYLYFESAVPYFFEEPDNIRVLLTVRDQFSLTMENYLLFQEISQGKKKLEELNQMKNDLISMVSHDFRSPLTVIHAYSELLLLNPNVPTETKNEYLHAIFEQIGHLRRLADGALKITQIDSGEMPYSFCRVEFKSLKAKFSYRNIPGYRILFKEEKGLPPMKGDPDKLFEILDNLISNAVKYSPGGSDVIVTALRKIDFVEIQVKDCGIGIAPDQVENLFQKYFRIHNNKTKNIRGTGLGLYICRKLVEGHGGRIWVRSKPGHGSTFYYTIPVFSD